MSMLAFVLSFAIAAAAPDTQTYGEKTFAGLELRPLGPALTSGRIVDLAVDPRDARIWYIATAGGGGWKTTDAGTSLAPIFRKEEAFSLRWGARDPHDPPVVLGRSGG